MRRSRVLGALALLLAVAVLAPAGAETVPVTLANPAGTRVVYVESMAGTALSSLDFGQARSLPFRVRVVDTQYGAAPFTVSATMTRLYRDGGTRADYIGSAKVFLGRQVNPLAASGVQAVVQPTLDLASTVSSTLCTLLGVASVGGTCTLTAQNVTGLAQTLVVDPATLVSGLPLVPQANETGPFTNAEFGAGTAGAGDPAASGAPSPTARKVADGGLSAVNIAALTRLIDVSPATDAISSEGILAALTANYPLISTLTSGQLSTIVSSTVATAQQLVLANVLNLTGTYLSLPTLDVDTSGAPTGSFTGTLVVTATQ